MSAPSNPSEIARETFRLLIARRIAPTPENYQKIFHEIAGTIEKSEPFPEKPMRSLLASLPRITPEQLRLSRELDVAIKEHNWDTFKARLMDFVGGLVNVQQIPWADLISELIRQWEMRQAGITTAKKRELLENALKTGGNPEALYTRLNNVIRHWGQQTNDSVGDIDLSLPTDPGPDTQTNLIAYGNRVTDSDLPPPLPEVPHGAENSRNLFSYTLETVITPLLHTHQPLLDEASKIATDIRKAHSGANWQSLNDRLRHFAFRLELQAEEDAELRSGLLGLLNLIINNIDQLVVDDKWLHGQVVMIQEIIDQPLSQRGLEDAERRMKDVIFKQSQLKNRLSEAQESLKTMLAGFVDHLANFAESTSDYHDKIESCANKISSAKNIHDLEDVISEVMRETRVIQHNAQRSRDELRHAQHRATESEAKIRSLESELAATSSLVRFDQLTGALNRRGIEEIFQKELKRSHRHKTPLCVALLDIDNFKKLNDSMGHDAGDAALIHLATVIRDTLRPEDSVARYGGEEFILLLPDTTVDDAQHVLVRLQRELTRRIFLYEHHKTLITFSAGIAQFQADDTPQSAIKRADTAMYQAKQSGKNRVCLA